MTYQKIGLEMVVTDDEAEVLIQALGDAADKIEKQVTVFDSEITVHEVGEPHNAKEIAGK